MLDDVEDLQFASDRQGNTWGKATPLKAENRCGMKNGVNERVHRKPICDLRNGCER